MNCVISIGGAEGFLVKNEEFIIIYFYLVLLSPVWDERSVISADIFSWSFTVRPGRGDDPTALAVITDDERARGEACGNASAGIGGNPGDPSTRGSNKNFIVLCSVLLIAPGVIESTVRGVDLAEDRFPFVLCAANEENANWDGIRR